ncbi:MAG: class I SAM-dependent methyltransferase [Anaerolineae bacterium]
MSYNPQAIKEAYNQAAEEEDQAEKQPSLRTEIPREFIKRYLKPSDLVLDAGGGTGINAIMMAQQCKKVTLLDITPRILELAAANIENAGLMDAIDVIEGDITDLGQFSNWAFSFVVCVGDSISYVLDKRECAVNELVRVARPGSVLIIGCDSKYGFIGLHLRNNLLDKAIEIYETSECYSVGAKTHLYTIEEMTELLESAGCKILEIASTPTLADTIDKHAFFAELDEEAFQSKWKKLKALEMQLCIQPELLGIGLHLLFVARKI